MKNFGLVGRPLWFTLLLLTLLVPAEAQAQKKRTARQGAKTSEKAPPPEPPTGSPIETALDIGSDFLNSAARLLGGDPYAPFRNARYSNDGLITEPDEMRLAAYIDREVRKSYHTVPTGQARLERIGQRVAAASLRPGLKYQFFVVKSDEINALSIPGGYIYVTTALMDLANDDELASVVAHELGHVSARHGLKSVKHAQALGQVADLLSQAVGVAGSDAQQFGKMATGIVGTGILATHGREDEREADYLGLHFMTKAGYKPEAMITMFQKLQKMKDTKPDLLGSIFSDHPDVDERISNTAYEIKQMRGGQ